MRAILYAGAISACMIVAASAQSVSVTGSGAVGGTSAGGGSLSAVTGNGENVSGGLSDSTAMAGDVSSEIKTPVGQVDATGGGSESDTTEVTFSQGLGHDVGGANAGGTAGASFGGGAVTFSATSTGHHH